MTKQVKYTASNGRQMTVFVAGEAAGRDGRPTLLVSKVAGSPYVFAVYADLCEEV